MKIVKIWLDGVCVIFQQLRKFWVWFDYYFLYRDTVITYEYFKLKEIEK